jgi:phage portal protein BeeE
MNFISRLFSRQRPTNSYYQGPSLFEVDYITHGSRILEDVSIASNAVDKVAVACMSTSPLCKENDSTVITTATKLLDKPNNEITGDELMYKIVEDLYIGGSSYVVLVGNRNNAPIELHRIKPTKVSYFQDANGVIVRYTVTMDRFSGEYILDVNSWRYLNADNDFTELLIIMHPSRRGILNSCREELNILSVGLHKNGALIHNGGRVSMLLTFKDNLREDEFKARMDSLEQTIRSKGYGGLVGITSGENGVDIQEMGLTPKDMDFNQLQEYCRREVYFRCGIPLPLVDNSASTHNNMQSANIQLYTLTVIPLCDLIYSKIGALIALREKRKYTTLTNQMLVPSIRDMLLTELEKRKKVGIETINEMRALSGLDSVEGGDQVYVEARMIPITSDATPLG